MISNEHPYRDKPISHDHGYLLTHFLTRSAARNPAKDAVRMDGAALTYEQLDRLTNQVARTLISLGVKRGDRVGLYVHKSHASVIGVFGIMKVGAAYVPLDPNAPAKRLAYITRDCGIKVIVTSSAKLRVLPEFFAEGSPLENVMLTDDAAETPGELPEQIKSIPWSTVTSQDGDSLPFPTRSTPTSPTFSIPLVRPAFPRE